MNISSLLKKRNYEYLYNIIKPYPKGVKNTPKDYSEFSKLSDIIAYLDVSSYDKIVVVASGPSSKTLTLEDKALYFTTNKAIALVKDYNHAYIVNDSYYMSTYLKRYKPTETWKGTFFWYTTTPAMRENTVIKMLYKYLGNKSRARREFLITNVDEGKALPTIHEELITFVKDKLGINYFGVNSGFVTLVLAYIIADLTNKNIEIYGLDMGEKGEGYFDKKVTVGKSIKGESTKKIVGEFLDKVYEQKGEKIINNSYFKTKL